MSSAGNVWKSTRFLHDDDHLEDTLYVPTLLRDNVRLVTDPNLDPRESGVLYYSREKAFDKDSSPEYVLTVHPDIYKRIMNEVNDSHAIPCGMYFCCHGGDGAHAGVSHDDYVDIRVAWLVVICLLAIMMFLAFIHPMPDNDDDFF